MGIERVNTFMVDGEVYVQATPLPEPKTLYQRFKEHSFWEDWRFIMLVISFLEMVSRLLPEIVEVY